VPTAKGFLQIDVARNEALKPPQPVIEQVALDGRVLGEVKEVKIAPGSHELEARFTAIRLGLAEGVRFRYRLEGLEQSWVETGTVRQAHYSHLPPGDFRLLVSARDASGAWSDPASIGIEQRPHLYQTVWFRILLALAALAMVAAVYRLRLRMLRSRYAAVLGERNRIAREFHDTLVGGLSAVAWQLDAARQICEDERVDASIKNAHGMLRYCRDEARRAVGDLRDEPEPEPQLEQAIRTALEQITAGTPVHATLEAAERIPDLPRELSSDLLRICQEATSNAIRHGHASEIHVRLENRQERVCLSISDNGPGIDPAVLQKLPEGHYGILGMRERTHRFGGALTISTGEDGGTLVEAVIPFPILEDWNSREYLERGA
jgi:signal transduction histidine kinase